MSERSSDDAVLDQLREHGDVGSIPRPVFIWIYGDEAELRTIEESLKEKGWSVTEVEDQGDVWVLRAEREQPATAEAIYAMSDEVIAALHGTDAKYDGWETSVEQSS